MTWRTIAAKALGAGAVLLAAITGTSALAAPPPSPRLVVAISVDQFSLALFQTYRSSFTGGLARLAAGRVFDGYQAHAATETCPGHSTILTGDHPARTGIVANSWYERASGSTVYCVSVAGVADPEAKGSAKLKVDALGDWLKAQRPGARSVAVSGKDRAAIMMGGHHPDAVYWWDDAGGFATSRYAGPTTPAVLAPAAAFGKETFAAWRASGSVTLWPKSVPPRCAALQAPHTFGALALNGEVPPQTAPGGALPVADPHLWDELRASPAFDPMTLRFAERLVDGFQLGKGAKPDLLAVSLSATDLIGHRYGNGGAEMCVQMAELDAALNGFLDHLDKLGAPYVVMLTADHGAVDAAERLSPPGLRIDGAALVGELGRSLRKTFDLGYDPMAGGDPRQLILALGPADEPRRPQITRAALAWLRQRPYVAAAYDAREIAAARPPRGKPPGELTQIERFALSYDAERSGDILVAYADGATLGAPQRLGDNVAGHGSPWDYDRRVPILFWWPGVEAASGLGPIETVDIAPTLAALLGLHTPDVDGRCVEIGQGCPR
jgi:predicted AlkP superfamily pyrophosphatase or phosphodiesterase